jgi:hypothetical protein
MFRIPEFYQVEMTFDKAVETIKNRAKGDLLAGMESMNKVWDGYIADQNRYYSGEQDEMVYGDDDDFFDHWGYECSAFNVVFENMSKLFAKSA